MRSGSATPIRRRSSAPANAALPERAEGRLLGQSSHAAAWAVGAAVSDYPEHRAASLVGLLTHHVVDPPTQTARSRSRAHRAEALG
jgi:hypothetical protein